MSCILERVKIDREVRYRDERIRAILGAKSEFDLRHEIDLLQDAADFNAPVHVA